MNIQQLRQSLKLKWLSYYEQNRSWLVKMRIWGTYGQLRRPSSGFILATMSVLEAQFDEILTFILDLNNDPDQIVAALGLNFNPDQELHLIKLDDSLAVNQVQSESTQEENCEDETLISLTSATEIIHLSSAENLPSELPETDEPTPVLTTTTEVDNLHKSMPAIAVATEATRILQSAKPQNQQVRSHFGTSLAMTTEVSRNSKAMPSLVLTGGVTRNGKNVRSLAITTKVPITAKTLPSLTLTTKTSNNHKHLSSLTVIQEVQSNDKYANMQPKDIPKKVTLSSSTNARSLASWVDEFCQGTRCDEQEAIFMQF